MSGITPRFGSAHLYLTLANGQPCFNPQEVHPRTSLTPCIGVQLKADGSDTVNIGNTRLTSLWAKVDDAQLKKLVAPPDPKLPDDTLINKFLPLLGYSIDGIDKTAVKDNLISTLVQGANFQAVSDYVPATGKNPATLNILIWKPDSTVRFINTTTESIRDDHFRCESLRNGVICDFKLPDQRITSWK